MDVFFCRVLLQELGADPAFRASGKRIYKDAWVWRAGNSTWEFHGPNDYYWHGRAGNAYDARYKGWSAWLKQRREP